MLRAIAASYLAVHIIAREVKIYRLERDQKILRQLVIHETTTVLHMQKASLIQRDQVKYLVDLLCKHGVEVDEFDIIALKAIANQ